MTIQEQIVAELRKEYSSGSTYQEIADRHGLSYTYARGIILGKEPAGRISLEKLLAMFPRARIELHPVDGVAMSQVMHHVGDGNRQVMGGMGSEALEAYQLRLYRGLATLPVPDDAKAKVLALIQSAGEAG